MAGTSHLHNFYRALWLDAYLVTMPWKEVLSGRALSGTPFSICSHFFCLLLEPVIGIHIESQNCCDLPLSGSHACKEMCVMRYSFQCLKSEKLCKTSQWGMSQLCSLRTKRVPRWIHASVLRCWPFCSSAHSSHHIQPSRSHLLHPLNSAPKKS